MGRFASKSSKTARERRSIIRVNPYELPEKALEVIANICSKTDDADRDLITRGMLKALEKKDEKGFDWWNFCLNYSRHFYNESFSADFNNLLIDLRLELQVHENTSDTQVVVAGGFSAGKSSFLNALVGVPNLLPTGIEPCSMVPTFLYCSQKIQEVRVKGVNLNNAVVLLDKDILQSIQHESQSKVYLASVLNKLFVELPSRELDGFVFIDTPGYNNSEKANAENGKTDEDVALAALDRGNVLLWVVDAGSGTVCTRDRQVIESYLQKNEKRRVVILFNKADKKGREEMQKIVKQTASQFASLGKQFIDVLGYSSMEHQIYCSFKGYNLPTLLKQIRSCGNGKSEVESILSQIDQLFRDEFEWIEGQIQDAEKERQEDLERKNKAYKDWNSSKDWVKEGTGNLKTLLVDSYDEILAKANELRRGWDETFDKWKAFYAGVVDFDINDHWGSSSVLSNAQRKAERDYTAAYKRYEKASDYSYYEQSYRKDEVDMVHSLLEYMAEKDKEYLQRCEEWVKEDHETIQTNSYMLSTLRMHHAHVMNELHDGIRKYQQTAHQAQDVRIRMNDSQNVFAAIAKRDYKAFTACFSRGVNLEEHSGDGYSPLTYAVREGNIQMVRFFIEQGADLSAYDGRGMNAFHTAVENGYRHLCELMLEEDASLAYSKTEEGNDALDVYRPNDFSNWLCNKI